MCGIVGYLGGRDADDVLLGGLRRLEYRGYDSAGLVTVHPGADGTGGFDLRRAVGPVRRLRDLVDEQPVCGSLGIAHTRWATHGQPSEANAHPHVDASGKVVLVHNGVIENHAAIREFLTKQGVTFRSETDTEVLAQLVGFFYGQTGDLLESVRRGLLEVRGTFGIAVVSPDAPHTLIAARRGSPLLVGQADGEYFIASDAAALAGQATRVTYLEDDEVVSLGPDGMTAGTIDDVPVEKQFDALEMAIEDVELDHTGFEHHMLKEIFEQPEALTNTLRGRVKEGSDKITLGGLSLIARQLPRTERLLLMGCGTAWHAGLIGEYLFEELAGIPCEVEYASELRYRNPIVLKNTLAVAVSQSGETADTLAALREVQTRGARVLGVVNTVGSTIARETDAGVYLHVGPEIGVASTKAFTAQVAVLTMMALDLGRRRPPLAGAHDPAGGGTADDPRQDRPRPRTERRGPRAGREAGRPRQLAVPRPRRELPRGAGGGLEAEGDQLHPRRGPARRGDEARSDRPDRRGDAGGRHRPAGPHLRESRLEHRGGEVPQGPRDRRLHRGRHAGGADRG